MSIREEIAAAVATAFGGVEERLLGAPGALEPSSVHLERPAKAEHGDWSTNLALTASKRVGRAPRELAELLIGQLGPTPFPHFEAAEVAGPGFVNFRLSPTWLHDSLRAAISAGDRDYGRSSIGGEERVQIEFVSANPTGPLHVGNGWFASYGDSLGRILSRCGWDVSREYYVNDTGGQIRALGVSLLSRKLGLPVPDEGYQGAYVSDLAAHYEGSTDLEDTDAVVAAGRWAAERILANIRTSLDRLGIVFDEWYSQASIEESGAVRETFDLLAERGLIYEEGGAVWLRNTELGDSRDRVLVKSDGDITYLGGDLAYHRNKFLVRGFERVIDVLGADHHGQAASLRAAITAFGVDPEHLEVKLGQMVSLVEGGQAGRMSKRQGNYVALDDLIAEIGADSTRLLSLMSSLDQATTIDLDVVRKQSMENPVFYIQYAHARIASIGRVARERSIARQPLAEVDLGVLTHARELEVLRALEVLPDVIEEAARDRAPHKVTAWARRLAGAFHGFHHDCPVLDGRVPEPVRQARLWLTEGARIGLAIGLDLLGVSAPESM